MLNVGTPIRRFNPEEETHCVIWLSMALEVESHIYGKGAWHGVGSKQDRSLMGRCVTKYYWDEGQKSRESGAAMVANMGEKAVATAHSHGIPTITSAKWYLDDLAQSWANMYRQTIDDAGPLSMGGEACMWTEQHNERGIDQTIFSRLPAVAERLWSSKKRSAFKSIARNRLARFQCKVLQQMYAVQMSSILPNFCPVHQGESVLQAERIPMKPGKFVSALPVKMCESIAFTHMVPWFLLGAIILNLAGRKCCPRLTRSYWLYSVVRAGTKGPFFTILL